MEPDSTSEEQEKLHGVLQALTCQSVVTSSQEEAGMTNHRAEDHPEEVESHHEEEETLASLEPPPEIPRENQTTGTCMLHAPLGGCSYTASVPGSPCSVLAP